MPLIYERELRVYWTVCGTQNNNAYLIVCPQTRESLLIDAPLNPGGILDQAKGTKVRAVLITHHHRDHTEGLQEILDATGAPVAIHVDDAEGVPFKPDLLLTDGEVITAGTVGLRVIHAPGHTPGSACFYAGGCLFTGDTLYAQSPGETRSPETTQQIIKSITERLFVLPDETIIMPGHGQGTDLGTGKRLYRSYAAQNPDVLPPLP